MKTYEIRTYSLKTAEAAAAYRQIWIKHIESLKAFDIVTLGVFTVTGDPMKVVALVGYPEGANLEDLSRRYMTSELFKADMAGFDPSAFDSVEATPLTPETFSPLQ